MAFSSCTAAEFACFALPRQPKELPQEFAPNLHAASACNAEQVHARFCRVAKRPKGGAPRRAGPRLSVKRGSRRCAFGHTPAEGLFRARHKFLALTAGRGPGCTGRLRPVCECFCQPPPGARVPRHYAHATPWELPRPSTLAGSGLDIAMRRAIMRTRSFRASVRSKSGAPPVGAPPHCLAR